MFFFKLAERWFKNVACFHHCGATVLTSHHCPILVICYMLVICIYKHRLLKAYRVRCQLCCIHIGSLVSLFLFSMPYCSIQYQPFLRKFFFYLLSSHRSMNVILQYIQYKCINKSGWRYWNLSVAPDFLQSITPSFPHLCHPLWKDATRKS